MDVSGGKPPPPPRTKGLQLQGPRPTPLRVSKDSHKIRKPHAHQAEMEQQPRQPLVIYDVSPKVIHADTNNFMAIVQRLTGPESGEVSPAARVASIERKSPRERERGGAQRSEDPTGLVEGVEVSQVPGILSPAPATLPPIPEGLFSPAADLYSQELNPFWVWNSFTASPSALLSSSIISPTNSFDIFNQF